MELPGEVRNNIYCYALIRDIPLELEDLFQQKKTRRTKTNTTDFRTSERFKQGGLLFDNSLMPSSEYRNDSVVTRHYFKEPFKSRTVQDRALSLLWAGSSKMRAEAMDILFSYNSIHSRSLDDMKTLLEDLAPIARRCVNTAWIQMRLEEDVPSGYVKKPIWISDWVPALEYLRSKLPNLQKVGITLEENPYKCQQCHESQFDRFGELGFWVFFLA